MESFLASPLFKVVLAVAALAVVWRIVGPLLFPAKQPPAMIRVRCLSCSWTGTVGKYNRRCSRCNGEVVEANAPRR